MAMRLNLPLMTNGHHSDQAYYLAECLKQHHQHNTVIFNNKSKHVYAVTTMNKDGNPIVTNLTFTHRILSIPKERIDENDEVEFSDYVITNSRPEQGGNGSVYTVLGKLSPVKKNKKTICVFSFKPNKYIIKEFNYYQNIANGNFYNEHRANSNNNAAGKEANLTKLSFPLFSKPIVTEINNQNKAVGGFILMRNKGEDLFKLRHYPFSTEERLRLSIQLLRQIQEQTIDRGIIHRDIKLDNILYDVTTNKLTVIDFGHSRLKDSPNELHKGAQITEMCTAPDFPLDEISDLYSAGLCIAEIWGVDLAKEYKTMQDLGLNYHPFIKLFLVNHDLSDPQKEQLFNLLKKITDKDKKPRGTFDDAIHELDQVRLQYKYNKLSAKCQGAITNANRIAHDAYQALRNITKSENIEVKDKLENVFASHIDQLDDSSYAVQEFIDVLDINVLKGLKTKKQVKEKVFSITENFRKKSNDLLLLLERAETYDDVFNHFQHVQNQNLILIKSDLHDLIKLTARTIDKERHYQVKLDDLAELNRKFDKKTAPIEKQLNTIAHNMKPVYSCEKIMRRLNENNREQNEPSLKTHIKDAMKYYIDETLTHANIKKRDRAASKKRRKDMKEILTILDKNNDQDILLKKVNHQLRRISFFGTSLLYKNIKQAIRDEKNTARADQRPHSLGI